MRPRRTGAGSTQLANESGITVDEASSSAATALLDIESGKSRRNGYLTVQEPSSASISLSERSRSASPLFLSRSVNGFLFPSPATATNRSTPFVKPPTMMRFVSKQGDCNVRHSNVYRKNLKYLADIFTTLVDCKWRWCALIFAMGFFSTWLFYAILYYIFAWLHDDLDKTHLSEQEWMPCINKIKDFGSAYLYSLETQHTIGYGYRFANTECPHVIIVLCLQCLTGVALQSILVGVLFAKLSRPKMRSETLMFSREACICQRDGKMHFMFRIGDMRRSHIVEAHIRVMCMKERVTAEGEEIPFYQYDVNVGFADGTDRLFLVWPTIISHEIDDKSPFYDLSAEDLKTERLEVIVILEGIVEATGLTTQARTSYLPSEIRWGYRFEKVVRPCRDGSVRIDHDYFNKIYYVDSTPRCSPRELYRQQEREEEEERLAEAALAVSNASAAASTTASPSRRSSLKHRSNTALLQAIRPSVHLALPPPAQHFRRRQSSPVVYPAHIQTHSIVGPNNDTVNEVTRRASTTTMPSIGNSSSSPAVIQDPLSCANAPVVAMQSIELPRVR